MSKMYRVEHFNVKSSHHYPCTFNAGIYGLEQRYVLDDYFDKFKTITGRERHPTPWFDDLEVQEDHYFGFRSIKQLERWFPISIRRQLAAHRQVVIRIYEGDNVLYGKNQMVMSVNGGVKRIGRLDMITLKAIRSKR